MQDLCEELLSPISEPWICEEKWVQAIEAMEATDLAQVTRCGRASLNQVSERLQQWKSQGLESTSAKDKVLAECCSIFIEQCAEIVEMAGVTPKLASNLLGASIRMAEVVGKTGLLLRAMESKFGQISEKISRLELVYDVVVKRVEFVAGEVSHLKHSADAAHAQAENALKREAETEAKCGELKRALQSSRNECLLERRKNGRVQKEMQDMKGPRKNDRIYGESFRKARSVERVERARSQHSEIQTPKKAFAEQIAEQLPEQGSLPRGAAQDPLEDAVKAALDHFLALLQQAKDLHHLSPSLNRAATSGMSNSSLVSMANDVYCWADSSLKLQDHVLAASLKQSASHLQCLVHLLNGRMER